MPLALPSRPDPSSSLPSALLAAEQGPAVMADDPCEAALGSADPTGPRNYYRARYYDPKIGRFISEDPVDYQNGVSPYPYVLSNPATWVDPSGLAAQAPSPSPSPLPCGGPCPSNVTQAKQQLCANASKITNVAARQCVMKQCGSQGAPITCNSTLCSATLPSGQPMNASGMNTGGSPNQIVICANNSGPNPSLCMSQRIAHEMFHACRQGGPRTNKGSGWTEPQMRQMHFTVPCY